jgi:hypothetical protein
MSNNNNDKKQQAKGGSGYGFDSTGFEKAAAVSFHFTLSG